MNRLLKSVIIVFSLLFLDLFVIWIATFILNKNELNGMPIMATTFAGIFLLVSYFMYGLILALLNKIVYHSNAAIFFVYFYLSVFIYIILALNCVGILPFIQNISYFDFENLIIKLHNIENDPLGIIVLMPLNLITLIFSATVSYILISFLLIQIDKTMKESNHLSS